MESVIPCNRLGWNHKGYQEFNLYKHNVAGDGHCILHSIFYAISIDYRNGTIGGVRYTRENMMIELRKELAVKLEVYVPGTQKTVYERILNGGLQNLGKASKNYSLEGLQALFRSNAFLGQEMILVIEDLFDKTIYVLDEDTKDVYVREDLPPERPSVVIYYSSKRSHFDMISVYDNQKEKHVTHFSPSHPFIKHLRYRLALAKGLIH